MNPKARQKLVKLGLTPVEVDCIEALPSLLAEFQSVGEKDRSKEVNDKIRERYSISQEFEVIRKKDTHPEEFAAYNEYVEECIREVNGPKEENQPQQPQGNQINL